MPAVGAQFRTAREARGLSLSEAAEEIHIRAVYLAEIEAENWRAIGPPVYVRGFLRTYARFLGLDPEEAVAEFNRTLPSSPANGVQNQTLRAAERNPGNLSPLIWIAGAVAVILIGFVIYNAVMLRQSGGTGYNTSLPSNQPTTSALPSVPLATSPPRAAPNSLMLRLAALSWLRVTVDGSVRTEGTFPAGTSKVFHGTTALVRVGNAGAVELFVDGKPIGKLGGPGAVVERTFKL